MTYVYPLALLRPMTLAGAVALSESPQSGRYAALISRLASLEARTRALQVGPPPPPAQRAAVVGEWWGVYLEIQDALAEAGLLTNAPAPVATLNAETER